jgi:Arc/MetJ-type ribon-helix-helix transcriptional regulator
VAVFASLQVDDPLMTAYPRGMTISLNKEQEVLLEKVLSQGKYQNAEEFIDQSLTTALAEDEAFNNHLRALLKESQDDIANGRLIEVPRGELFNTLERRRKERLQTNNH